MLRTEPGGVLGAAVLPVQRPPALLAGSVQLAGDIRPAVLFLCVCVWCWGLSPGPFAGEAGTLPTELHPQPLASGFCSSCFIPSGAPPVFATCSTEWLLHVHFWPPQGTPVSAWRPVSRTPGPGPTWCHLHEENGEEAGRGEPSCVFSFYLFTF